MKLPNRISGDDLRKAGIFVGEYDENGMRVNKVYILTNDSTKPEPKNNYFYLGAKEKQMLREYLEGLINEN